MMKINCKLTKIFFSSILMIFTLFQSLNSQSFYWENPKSISTDNSMFPKTVSNKNESFILWQEVDFSKKEIYLSLKKIQNQNFSLENNRFAGPFSYSNEEVPEIFSCAVLDNGTLSITVVDGDSSVYVFTSTDGGNNFFKTKLRTSGLMISPRIFKTNANIFRIFISFGKTDSFNIYTATSKDGIYWSKFELFEPTKDLKNSFNPVLIPYKNGDFVVFQSQYIVSETGRISYQLYSTFTNSENGKWSNPVLITNENSVKKSDSFFSFQNQRPSIYFFQDEIYLAWERTKSSSSSIWIAKINENGILSSSAQEQVFETNAFRPELFTYKNNIYLTWFDSRKGSEAIYFAMKQGDFWNEIELLENENANLFINPLVLKENSENGNEILSFVWQQNLSEKKSSIAILLPDKSVEKPNLIPLSFKKYHRNNLKKVKFQINLPFDSSGIKSYSYVWSKNQNEEIPNIPMEIVKAKDKSVVHTENAENGEGTYYFSVKIQDYAGNWSEQTSLSYDLDTTPPSSPEILFDNCDKNHILNSNEFKINWMPSKEIDTAGYVYKFEYISKIPKSLADSQRHPCKLSEEEKSKAVEKLKNQFEKSVQKNKKIGSKILTMESSTPKFYNYSNGVYAFYLAPIDDVGNVGKTEVEMFIINKFEPSTYVKSAQFFSDELGENNLTIYGGGFTYDGKIDKIIIDDDGIEPYKQILFASNNDFKINDDKSISKIKLNSELEEGSYLMILHHTDRGFYKTGKLFTLKSQGTVKVEADYKIPNRYKTEFENYKYKVIFYVIILILLFIFCCFIIFFIFKQLISSLLIKILAEKQIKSVIKGKHMPIKQLRDRLKKQQSLKTKLIIFTFSIIVFLVINISLQNGIRVINLQKETLAKGLESRIEVLEESIQNGIKNFLPTNNILELSALPSQKDAMEEVEYITIIGQPQNSKLSRDLNVIWATNDSNISEKSDSSIIAYGISKITDEDYRSIVKKMSLIDGIIPKEITNLSEEIEKLSLQATELYNSLSEDEFESIEYLTNTIADLRNQRDLKLLEFSKKYSSSFPIFNSSNFDMDTTEYVFYRPVLYYSRSSDNYIHAIIFIKVSTQNLIDSINAETARILRYGIFVALGAIILGIFITAFFATLIIKPIKKLEKYVTLIGHTKNKVELKGKEIEIKSKDEIGRLGSAVNNMTNELVKAAEEEILNLDGKSVQNAFLPLDGKSSTAHYDDSKIQCFGFYEGESSVSGDYFDYHKLDEQWFIAIKCDASGHGVPAAIIMTVVATLFRKYVENWNFKKNGIQINKLIEQVNDSIESLGLKGKFATIIICLINQASGEVFMCNAGDSIVHIYDNSERKIKTLTLENAPTAGVFPSSMIANKFKIDKTVLKHGDILFLYTDGIEESKRIVRDSDFMPKMESISVKKMNPKTYEEEVEIKLEEMQEDFGSERIFEIIESVMNKKKYVLSKLDNPRQNEILEFDFSNCESSLSDAIIALASCEKIFRLYKVDGLTRTDYVKIDKKIDEFLKKYFNNYELYSRHKTQNPNTPNYFDYEHMKEDSQSDDLTMLAIKRI